MPRGELATVAGREGFEVVELAQVLDRIGLAFLRCEVAELAAEVCPPFRVARAALLEAGEGGTFRNRFAGAATWTPAHLAGRAWGEAMAPAMLSRPTLAAEALAALPDPFTAKERADFTARGWLLDPDGPAVAEALAPGREVTDVLEVAQRLRPAFASHTEGLCILADAMAAALRRRAAPVEIAATLARRRVAFRAAAVNRMRRTLNLIPRRETRRHHNIARIYLRRHGADPEILAAAEVDAAEREAEALATATARRAHRDAMAAEGRARLEAQRAALAEQSAANLEAGRLRHLAKGSKPAG